MVKLLLYLLANLPPGIRGRLVQEYAWSIKWLTNYQNEPKHIVSSNQKGISYNGTMFMIAPSACIRFFGVRQGERRVRTDGNVRPIDTFLTWLPLHTHDCWLRGWIVDIRREK